MGNFHGSYAWNYERKYPDISPIPDGPPRFDPLFGFPNGRKERESLISKKDMEKAGIPLDRRDYCAHKYLEETRCRRNAYFFATWSCKHQRHEYEQCVFDDYMIRFKEYERERRLLVRQQRIQSSLNAEAAAA